MIIPSSSIHSIKFFNILKQHNQYKICVRNRRGRIQAKCPFGRKYGGQCFQQLHETHIWTIIDRLNYKFVYVPVLKCTLHRTHNISYIYGHRNELQRFRLGPFDELTPDFRFYTM